MWQFLDRLRIRRAQDKVLWALAVLSTVMSSLTLVAVVSVYMMFQDFLKDRAAGRERTDIRWKALETNQESLSSAITGLRTELALTDQATKINEKQIDLVAKEQKAHLKAEKK